MALRDHAEASGSLVWYSVLILAILVVATFATYSLKPTWLGMEREAYKASHQYIESKQTMLLNLAEKFRELEVDIIRYEQAEGDNSEIIDGLEAQKTSLLFRMRKESERLPDNELPESVRKILQQYSY